MGLDMYLKGKRYISSYFNEGDNEKASKIAEMFPELSGIPGRFDGGIVKEVMVELGYWRKANAIHNWFVTNVQGGTDECQPSYVGRDQLEELRNICQEILADRARAQELLPPTSGFFFGSTEVDDYYFQDLEETVKIIETALALPDSWEFEYQSSW